MTFKTDEEASRILNKWVREALTKPVTYWTWRGKGTWPDEVLANIDRDRPNRSRERKKRGKLSVRYGEARL